MAPRQHAAIVLVLVGAPITWASSATPPCHRIDSDGVTCTQSEDADTCKASYANMKEGSCAKADYAYCFKGAFGTELWAKSDGESCAEGMRVLRKTGYANDGCGGKSQPLPCGLFIGDDSSCHELVGPDHLSCQDVPPNVCQSPHALPNSCADSDYKYCYIGVDVGGANQKFWAKDGESCTSACKNMASGAKNDGCNGLFKKLPCCNDDVVHAKPPCHRANSDGLTCTQSENADTCQASYAQMDDGSCASAEYAYCFTGAFGMELWAKGDGKSCAEAMVVLRKTGYSNDGCGGKSKPLPCGSDKIFQV